jgi:peroxiredoxin (alkyl hydroperoxide reductase subunit C)
MKYLIDQECPDFVAAAIMPDGSLQSDFRLSDYLAAKYGVLFFYPLDFNYISWTELLSLQKRLSRFAERNAAIVAISCDSHLAHHTWRSTPVENNGLGPLAFPLVSDMTRSIARSFDILVAEAMSEAATIIVDRENKIMFQIRHDTAIGRNIDRILKVIAILEDEDAPDNAPIDQILQLDKKAPELQRLGFNIVAQSFDTDLDHPQWKRLPRDKNGQPKLNFPFVSSQQEWPKGPGMTIAVREGLHFHSIGLLNPDGQLLFEYHTDRQVPRDFEEILRLAEAMHQHLKTGQIIPWEKPSRP